MLRKFLGTKSPAFCLMVGKMNFFPKFYFYILHHSLDPPDSRCLIAGVSPCFSIYTLKSIGDGQSRIAEVGRRNTPVLEKFITRLLRYDAAGAGATSRQRESKSGILA